MKLRLRGGNDGLLFGKKKIKKWAMKWKRNEINGSGWKQEEGS